MKSIFNLWVITDQNDSLDRDLYKALKKNNYPVIIATGTYNGAVWHPWVVVNISLWSVNEYCRKYKQENYEYHTFSGDSINVDRGNYKYSISTDDLQLVDSAIYAAAEKVMNLKKRHGYTIHTPDEILNWLYAKGSVGHMASMTREFLYKQGAANATAVDGFLFSADYKTLYGVSRNKSGELIVPDGVEIIGSRAFAGCNKIKSVVISKDVKQLYDGAFENCKSLKKVRFCNAEPLIHESDHPSDNIFTDCDELEEVDYGVNKTVFAKMFMLCSKLKTFHGPCVTSVQSNAFDTCYSLKNFDVSPQMEYDGNGFQYSFFGSNSRICERYPQLTPIDLEGIECPYE